MAKCPRCQAESDPQELRDLMGEKVCEDCYLKVVDFTKDCDPWASYIAKRTLETQGRQFTPEQQKLYNLVKAEKEIAVSLAAKKLGWADDKIHHELITLRHMEILSTKALGPDVIMSLGPAS